MTTFPHGTTIEVLADRGKRLFIVCNKGGGMCRISDDEYQAYHFADLFEEYAC